MIWNISVFYNLKEQSESYEGGKKPRKYRVTYFEPKYLNIANKIEGI